MNWTKEQQEAIDARGRNLLVAAAAGSGKTAVLVERIKKLILEDGVSIDRMLVVTFTDAAASEMRSKLRRALLDEIQRQPAQRDRLRQQLQLLPRAQISTFHAFALKVIRQFFYTVDVEPGFTICDDARRTILKEASMDTLLETWFAEEDEAFQRFLDCYSGARDQSRVREILDRTYNVLQSLPDPWQWLDEKVAALDCTPEAFAASPLMGWIWQWIDETMTQAVDLVERAAQILDDAALPRLAERVRSADLPQYLAIRDAAARRDFAGTASCTADFAAARLVAAKAEKEDYEKVKPQVSRYRSRAASLVKSMRTLCFAAPLEEQVAEMAQTAPQAETLRRLLLDFDRIFTAAKAEQHMMDFNDIEHCCLRILRKEEVAAHYRERFSYIFIDEYQDTNLLQEALIGCICRPDDLFMVGDIKQSIYRFRLAEPEIFRRKYEAYGQEPCSMRIDLNRNFRSRPVILDTVNRIFADLMEAYDARARLYAGLPEVAPERMPGDGGAASEAAPVRRGLDCDTPRLYVVDTGTASEADPELTELRNVELEALAVCRLIRENLGRPFFDHKAGRTRPLELRDIVVLMRGIRSEGDTYYRILKEQGILSFVDDSEGYFDTMEIRVFLHLLSVIDNKMQDVPLLSVLHAELFGFSAEELGRIRAAHPTGSYAEAFFAYGGSADDLQAGTTDAAGKATDDWQPGTADTADKAGEAALAEKCAQTRARLRRWKAMATVMPLGSFLWQLMLETGYYTVVGAMPGGSQRQANLRALLDQAESYSRNRPGSLYSFVRYIDAIKARKVPMGQVKLVGEQDDLVRIMTIHKSKGLEFPMVIVSGLGRQLTYTRASRGVTLHKDIGLGLTLVDYAGRWYRQTLVQKLINLQMHREEVQEEIRVLYVALTRARNFLALTGTVRDGDRYLEKRASDLGGDGCYLDMLQQGIDVELLRVADLAPEGGTVQIQDRTGQAAETAASDVLPDRPVDPALAAELQRRLSFVYPYEAARQRKSKYAVTELQRDGQRTDEAARTLAVPGFRQEKRTLTAAERGTVYHGMMERLDFAEAARTGLPYLRQAADRFVDRGIFTREEVDAVDLTRIETFFRSAIGQRCAAAAARGGLQRERSFNLQMELAGEPVVVQGIIDCFFEEDGALVLLDYKTNRTDPDRPQAAEAARLRAMYAGQIDIYRQALETVTGLPVREAYLYLFDAGIQVDMPAADRTADGTAGAPDADPGIADGMDPANRTGRADTPVAADTVDRAGTEEETDGKRTDH